MLNITVAGRLGRDSELRTAGNDKVLGFTVAVDTGFGDKKTTVWVECSLWGKRGETLAQYLTKGASVTVTGDGGLRAWESNGKSGTSLTCRVNSITLQGGKRDGDSSNREGGNSGGYGGGQRSGGSSGGSGGGSGWEPPADLDDEIPF
jgi:single-strand DNA-binding protein